MVDAIEKFADAGLALLTNGIAPDLPRSGTLEHLEFFGVILSDAVSAAWGLLRPLFAAGAARPWGLRWAAVRTRYRTVAEAGRALAGGAAAARTRLVGMTSRTAMSLEMKKPEVLNVWIQLNLDIVRPVGLPGIFCEA